MGEIAALVLLGAGIALVVAGAELFFEALMESAARLRVSAFAVSVLLSGFELENLAAGIFADLKGLPGAAAGTFLGGTTFVALGVAGLGAAIAPMAGGLSARALALTAAGPLPLLALSLDGRLSRLDGALLVVWFAVALVALARSGERREEAAPPGRRRAPVLRLLAGLALLGLGGEVLGEGIRRTVARLDVSQTLIGNTAVAAGVEGEEVARVVVPARRGRGDVALGNVAGTIVHFVSLNAGVIALVRPLPLDHATRVLHLPAAAASPALLCGLLGARRRLGRPEGALLIALYAAYLAAAVALGV